MRRGEWSFEVGLPWLKDTMAFGRLVWFDKPPFDEDGYGTPAMELDSVVLWRWSAAEDDWVVYPMPKTWMKRHGSKLMNLALDLMQAEHERWEERQRER